MLKSQNHMGGGSESTRMMFGFKKSICDGFFTIGRLVWFEDNPPVAYYLSRICIRTYLSTHFSESFVAGGTE